MPARPAVTLRGILVRVKRREGAAALLAFAMSTSSAHGQTAADVQGAERDFQAGLTAEKAGDWSGALAEFVEARELARKETPQLLYHLGLCHSKLGKLVLGREELLEAVKRAQADGLQNVATTASAQLSEVQPRIASLALTAPARGAVSSATVDGVDATGQLGTSIDLDPGPHQVRITYRGALPTNLHVTLGDGEHRAIAVPEPAAEPVPLVGPAARSGKLAGWILIGGGASLAIGGAIFWALRDGAVSTLTRDCGPTGHACPESDQSTINTGKVDDAVGVALLTAGAAATLAGAGFLLFSGSRKSETTAVRLGPLVTRQGGGLRLQGALW
jgi:hypothetical protein